jgi:hypothetical protein
LAVDDVNLNFNDLGLEADDGATKDFGEHIPLSQRMKIRKSIAYESEGFSSL